MEMECVDDSRSAIPQYSCGLLQHAGNPAVGALPVADAVSNADDLAPASSRNRWNRPICFAADAGEFALKPAVAPLPGQRSRFLPITA